MREQNHTYVIVKIMPDAMRVLGTSPSLIRANDYAERYANTHFPSYDWEERECCKKFYCRDLSESIIVQKHIII